MPQYGAEVDNICGDLTDVHRYPLRPTNSQSIRCFLVLGLNKTRRYDDDYKDLIRLVCRQLTSAMASIMINEDELRKGQKSIEQAAVEKALLSDEILKRTRETRDLETRFLRVAELAPVGIFIFAPDGSFIYVRLLRSGHHVMNQTEQA